MKWMSILFLAAMSASAELTWETTDVRVNVHPVQIHTDALFHFTNEGKETVTFSSVTVSCGCLVPKLEKKTFAPGEAGEITVRFDLRGRNGKQSKSTIVKTDDGKTTTLMVNVDIPASFTIAPIMMKWTKDNLAATKTATLINTTDVPINLLSASTSNPAVKAKLKTIRAGFEYEVVVERPEPGSNVRAVIRVKPEPPPGFEAGKEFKFYVHAL